MPATQGTVDRRRRSWLAGLGRGAGYLALWMAISGGAGADLAPGLAASTLATWASLRLMPPGPGGGRVRWLPALALFGRFVLVSVAAGLDVAARAFSPRMRLAPGYVMYRPRLPVSDARSLFLAMTGQMPGTIPSGTDPGGTIAYHCLDASQPVADRLAKEEARLLAALGGALGSSPAAGDESGGRA